MLGIKLTLLGCNLKYNYSNIIKVEFEIRICYNYFEVRCMKRKSNLLFIFFILNIFLAIKFDFDIQIMIFDLITISILLLYIIIKHIQSKFDSIDKYSNKNVIKNKSVGKINKKTSNDELLELIKDFLSNKEDKNE